MESIIPEQNSVTPVISHLPSNMAKTVAFNINDKLLNSDNLVAVVEERQLVPFANINNDTNVTQSINVSKVNVDPSNTCGQVNMAGNIKPRRILSAETKGILKATKAIEQADPEPVSVPGPDVDTPFYTIFGIHLSKTTVYIIIAFLIVIIAYYFYNKYYNNLEKPDKKKKKRTSEVSLKEQEKIKDTPNKDDTPDE
jgi:uncharacterized membrane protein